MEDTQHKAHTPAPAGAAIPGLQRAELRRAEDFIQLYANNVVVESNAFDLKLVFGVSDLRNVTKPVVEQSAAVNLSWPEVKLLIFWMQVHLAGYEKENGKVKIPVAALPPEVSSSLLPPQFDNPAGREGLDLIRKLRAEFLAGLSEP
jgi:hypothetical protein